MAALPSGIQTGYVGVAGRTGNTGLDFVTVMRALSIDHQYVEACADEPSGLCIAVNHDGIRSFLFYPGGNDKMADYLQKNYHNILQYAKKAKLLHVTQFTDERISVLLAKLIKDAKRENPTLKISCDPGFCWLKNFTPALGAIIKSADILFLNAIELNLLCGSQDARSDAAKAAFVFAQYELQETCLILKNPVEIKTYCRCQSQIIEQIYPIDVVSEDEILDATGAGDVFAAGVLTVLLLPESSMEEAVDLGVRFMRAKLLMSPDKLYLELKHLFSGA
jgi:sugar/nucleoside kinase (ribokinase family)